MMVADVSGEWQWTRSRMLPYVDVRVMFDMGVRKEDVPRLDIYDMYR